MSTRGLVHGLAHVWALPGSDVSGWRLRELLWLQGRERVQNGCAQDRVCTGPGVHGARVCTGQGVCRTRCARGRVCTGPGVHSARVCMEQRVHSVHNPGCAWSGVCTMQNVHNPGCAWSRTHRGAHTSGQVFRGASMLGEVHVGAHTPAQDRLRFGGHGWPLLPTGARCPSHLCCQLPPSTPSATVALPSPEPSGRPVLQSSARPPALPAPSVLSACSLPRPGGFVSPAIPPPRHGRAHGSPGLAWRAMAAGLPALTQLP